MKKTDTNAKFRALASDTRRQMIQRLAARGELCVGDLAEGITDATGSAISRHVRALEDAGLVERRVDHARRMISLRPGALGFLAEWAGIGATREAAE